jgi:HK97 family phage major capsid protein
MPGVTMPGMEHLNRLFGRRAGLTSKEAQDFGPAAYIEAVVRRDEVAINRFREVNALAMAQAGLQQDNMNFIAIAPEALLGVPQQRDMTKAGVSGSNYLVGVEQPAFVAALRSRSLVARLPIAVIDATGDATLPAIGSATTAWLPDENTQTTDAAITINSIAVTPKHVATKVTISQQFGRQTTEAARRALDAELALAVDAAIASALVNGSGASGEARGLVNWSGIGSQSGGTIAWSAIAALQAGVDAYDVGDCMWVVGSGAAATLRARTRESGSGRFVLDTDGIAGKPAIVHSSCPSTTAVVGCWNRLALTSWGPLQIAVDPYSSFRDGKITVGLRQLLDVAVLSPAAFGKATGIS